MKIENILDLEGKCGLLNFVEQQKIIMEKLCFNTQFMKNEGSRIIYFNFHFKKLEKHNINQNKIRDRNNKDKRRS